MKKRLLLFLFLLIVIVNVSANNAPVFNETKSSEVLIKEYETFNYQLNASDPDNDELTFYDLASLVNFSSFKMNNSGYINFKVSHGDIGYYPVIIVVRDTSWVADVITINFSVSQSDKIIPSIKEYAPGLEQTIDENNSIKFNVNSSYDANDSMTFKWFLDNVEKSSNANNFTYNSNYASAGKYNITFIINDSNISVSSYLVWNIMINDVNLVPYLINNLSDINITQGRDHSLYLNEYFEDADGDTLSYRAVLNQESNITITIDNISSEVLIEPGEDFNGKRILTFFVIDQANNSIFSAINLSVDKIEESSSYRGEDADNKKKEKKENTKETNVEGPNKVTGAAVNLPKENKIIETVLEKAGFDSNMFKKPNISWGIIGVLIIIIVLIVIWIKIRINKRRNFGF
jgi:hypothetical protein